MKREEGKGWPMVISYARGVFGLLGVPLAAFFGGALATAILNMVCQMSDPIDGHIARKQGTASKEGEIGDKQDVNADLALFVGQLIAIAILQPFDAGLYGDSVWLLLGGGLAAAAVGQAIYLYAKSRGVNLPIVFIGSVVLQGVFAFLFLRDAGLAWAIVPYGAAFGMLVWAFNLDRLRVVFLIGSALAFAPIALGLLP